MIPFNKTFDFQYGKIERVAPMIRRVVARNPSPFTFHGTGTYIVGEGEVSVIDPGPDSSEHVDAVLDSMRDETITHILITHTHRDHSPASRALQTECNAISYGFGPHANGNCAIRDEVEEGADWDFVPDVKLYDGDVVQGNGWSFECVHTPGHTSNHMCFQLREQKALFCGDHVMGWSTSIISPPDGNMTDYLESLEKLLPRDDSIYWPTHGAAIEDPKPFVRAYIDHRQRREKDIIQCLERDIGFIRDMVPVMYHDLPGSMYPAAARSVFATLLHLHQRGEVSCDSEPSLGSLYRCSKK